LHAGAAKALAAGKKALGMKVTKADKKAAKKAGRARAKQMRAYTQQINKAKNIRKAARAKFCPSGYPDLPNEFPLVIDRRHELKQSVMAGKQRPQGTAYFASFYERKKKQSSANMKKSVMIILHQTAGGRPRNGFVDGNPVGKKIAKYQTWAGKTVSGNPIAIPVHFFCDMWNSYWNYALEYSGGGGDQQLNGGHAAIPAIGIEIMQSTEGIVGSPPGSGGSGKGSMTMSGNTRGLKRQIAELNTAVDGKFARSGPTGGTLPPSQIAALRETIQFIIAYLQKNYGTQIIYIATHRAGFKKKPNCPGEYAFRWGVAPILEQMGLQPLPFHVPYKGPIPFGAIASGIANYSGGKVGIPFPESYVQGFVYEDDFKNNPYTWNGRSGGRPFTREAGWNVEQTGMRPLTFDEARTQRKAGEWKKHMIKKYQPGAPPPWSPADKPKKGKRKKRK